MLRIGYVASAIRGGVRALTPTGSLCSPPPPFQGEVDTKRARRCRPRDLRSTHPKPVEKRPARMAVGGHPKTLLNFADVVAQVEIKVAVEIGDLITEACELFLQRDALSAGRLKIVDRPGAAEGICAAQPVGEMRHRERIG